MSKLHIATMQAANSLKKLAKIRKNVRAELEEHINTYNKTQDIDQLTDDMQDTLEEGYTKAFKLGLQKQKLGPKDSAFLKKVKNKQFDYLDGFIEDIENNSSKMPIAARLDMYANFIDSFFWYGSLKGKDKLVFWNLDVEAENCPDCVELASNSPYDPLDLPTVPRAGDTECLNNCKCFLSHQAHGFVWSK